MSYTNSNQRLGSAFYRIRGVGCVKKSKWKTIRILSRPSGLESMYTKTRPKAPETARGAAKFAVCTKYPAFSRLRNEMRMRSLVPRECKNRLLSLEHGKQYSYRYSYTQQRESTCLPYLQWFENKTSKV